MRRAPIVVLLFAFPHAFPQSSPEEPVSTVGIARLIHIDSAIEECAQAHCDAMTKDTATLPGLFLRQQIAETITAAFLDVDTVLAEISNEHARLLELRSILQSRRDRAVNLASTANLITGTGIGIAVNALQFKDSTALIGDGIGVGSGIGSTVLSIIGIRLQNGPQKAVSNSPNMLAVLFGRQPELHSGYPPIVVAYLNQVPSGEAPERGTRIEQLKREWQASGRLPRPGTAQEKKKVELLTSTLNQGPRLSISDLTDRAFMLEDVAGRVALMNRDLAALLKRTNPGRDR